MELALLERELALLSGCLRGCLEPRNLDLGQSLRSLALELKGGGWRLVNVWPRHTFVRSRAAAATTVDSVHTRFTFAGLCEAAIISTPGGDELIDLVACFG